MGEGDKDEEDKDEEDLDWEEVDFLGGVDETESYANNQLISD